MPAPYQGSPLEGLATSIPEQGLMLVVGRSRVGKTAFLVHAAMEAVLADRRVLHVEVRDPPEFVYSHYDDLRRMLGDQLPGEALAVRTERLRRVQQAPGGFSVARLVQRLDMMAEAEAFEPSLLLVDGLTEAKGTSALLTELAALAEQRGMTCWVAIDSDAPVASEVFGMAHLVLRLVATESGPARIRIQCVHGPGEGSAALLDPDTLFVIGGDEGPTQPASAARCTLYSGGASGAEVAFGEAAARHGVREVAFTFEGHMQERTVGSYELSPRELAMGDVSLGYVSRRLNRSYNGRGGLIRGVLQALWHMVSRSEQVFVIGEIQSDGTVRGGTGWGVELARMWGRELWVFDQPEGRWCRWEGEAWVPGEPRITASSVCGTGTRKLTEVGREAVDALFRASFPS